MAITFVSATLYFPNSLGDLYVPAGSLGHVHNIHIHNTNTITETVVINKKVGSTNWEIFKMDIPANATVLLTYAGEGLLIATGNKITGLTTTASKVVFDISSSEDS